jgi:phycobilisome rod-core linker protein
MGLPRLDYPLSTQNQRVEGYEIPGDEFPICHSTDNLPDATEIDILIWAAYRQVFNEQQIIDHHRQVCLESQLKQGQITVRDFIRGLVLSDPFRRLSYDANPNNRFVEICVQRLLGRPVYNQRETLSWAIMLGTEGLQGFVDALLNSDEYLENFGDHIVPYQRRRILPQRAQGDLPLARLPRYDQYQTPGFYGYSGYGTGVVDRSAAAYRKVLFLVPTTSLAMLAVTLMLVLAP